MFEGRSARSDRACEGACAARSRAPFPRCFPLLAAALAFGAVGAAAVDVHAQGSPEPSTVDAVRGTITGSTRYIGLAGAFVAIADDTEGVPINPASAAVRLPYSWSAFAYGFGIDFSFGTWLPKNDIYNVPETAGAKGGSLFGSFSTLVNYRHFGFGIAAEAEQNAVSHQAQGVSTKLSANFGVVHTVAAYGYFDGQLELGMGLRILGLSFAGSHDSAPLAAGVGYEAGTIVKLKHRPYRIGISIKQPINAEVPGEPGAAPVTVHVPWTAEFGFAYQFGTRELNPSFVTALERARQNAAGCEPTTDDIKRAEKELFDEYQQDQTWYLLVSTELALIQSGGNVGLGTNTAIAGSLVSPRLGLETEVVPRYLRLRTGSYLELAVSEQGHSRLHATGGVDIKLFEWDVFGLVRPFDYWQLSLAADGAARYLNTSFSIGFWH
jgi:hypothetical protein